MKLLVITQVVDSQDPVLGFFHNWLLKFSSNFDQVTAICLKRGKNNLEGKVKVLSLGKEDGPSRPRYLFRLFKYIWRERKNYDAVFVHMNQEYVLLAGWLWWLLGKKVYLWRNHHSGSWLTDFAALFCQNIFCTSKYSYTAKYRKTILMPVGIDTDIFKPLESVCKIPNSILFISRIAPVKKPHVLLEALKKVSAEGVTFQADFYGDPLPSDEGYYQRLKDGVTADNLSESVRFYPGVPNTEITLLYNQHEVSINLSSSGMYDKTIFEAMSCGGLILACNRNLIGQIGKEFLFEEDDSNDLAQKLRIILSLDQVEKRKSAADLRRYTEAHHSLDLLVSRLKKVLSKPGND
jgi:glycosyltransferase involved in cell wall biosynthesis